MNDVKLTKKQIEIIKKARDGYEFFIGTSETSGRQHYYISKGFDNIYFRADTFTRLLHNKLIYQEQRTYYYELTELGETINLTPKNKQN